MGTLGRRATVLALSAFAVPTALAFAGAPALAQNTLTTSEPANGAVLKRTPDAVTLTFAEPVDARFVRVSVVSAAGRNVTSGKPAVSGSTVRQALGRLEGGRYLVVFRAAAATGNPVQGSLTFTAPASPAPASAGASSPVTAGAGSDGHGRTASSSGSGNPWLKYGLVGLLCLAGIAAVGLKYRQSVSGTQLQGSDRRS